MILKLKKKEQVSKNLESTKSEIGWGHQIRSYVLHPYRLVKDNITNYDSSNPDKVLEGAIDGFLESSLYKTND
jgi:peptide chain release factor 2